MGEYGSGGDKHTTNETIEALYRHLVEHRVKLSMRRGVMRFSLHVYNHMDDVEKVVELAREFLKGR